MVVDAPAIDQLDALHDLCSACVPAPVAALVDDTALCYADALFSAGIQGVVPRSMRPHLIVRAFEMVLLGGCYVPPAAIDLVPPGTSPERASGIAGRLPLKRPLAPGSLSPRQIQIMRFIHMGNTNKMIARTLGISEGTVKIHLASIFQQLGAANRAAAVAIYNGWLPPHLEVLSAARGAPARPALGEQGPVPLRGRIRRYPSLELDEATDTLPMAAEAGPPRSKHNK